jgi:hypothetical protein
MGRANVYLPDDLESRVKAAQIPISEVCQRALLAAVEAVEGGLHPYGDAVGAQFERGWEAGIRWAGTAPHEALLTLLRDQRLAEIPSESLPQDLYSLTQEQALAWEAGFMEAGRAATRIPLPATVSASGGSQTQTSSSTPDATTAEPAEPAPNAGPDSGSRDSATADSAMEEEPSAGSGELGDDSGCQIGVTLDGDPVSFDPHAAVRAGKSPLFAILGQADLRARLTLSVAQDAASRGTGVVLLDLSGQLASRAVGLGKNVRLINRPQASLPKLEELVQGAVGLGGLWETVAGLSRSSGLGDLLGGPPQNLIEPGYVSIISLAGDGQIGAALSAAQILGQLVSPADFPRLVHVDLPAGMSIPAGFGGRLGRIVRMARAQNAAIGLSAENADTAARIGGSGALLSTVFAFATSSPVEAERLRDLLGSNAPILLNPPGASTSPSDETWAVMRDLNGRLGQVRMDGW